MINISASEAKSTAAMSFDSPDSAAVVLLAALADSSYYSRKPLSDIWKIVRHCVSAGNFLCIGDAHGCLGVSMWGRGDAAHVSDYYQGKISLKCLASRDGDHIFVAALTAKDKTSLSYLARATRKLHVGRQILWDRHKGRIGTMVG